jgi:2-(1,2-epoxy-1,2-dihydrophenyl)acetyl-CoA isomerase
VSHDFGSLTLDVADGVATVTLAQGDRGNPFDASLCAELSLAATACDEDPAVRAVLLRAEGRFHSAVSRFARMDAPVVVAVHALAAGGGVSLLAGGDVVVAGRSARFVAAYQGIGLAIDGGGSHHVPRRVGHGRATSFYLRNQTWSADDALAYGLVDELADDEAVLSTAQGIAAELASGPTRAYGEVKTSWPRRGTRRWRRSSSSRRGRWRAPATRTTRGRASPRWRRSAALPTGASNAR